MSLKYALLGFLNYNDMTGYELKHHFDHSIRHFWNANLSQIYPTLSQLEKDGLLETEMEYQENRPNRKICKITDAGRAELKKWLSEPREIQPVREPFLVQVFFGAQLEKEKIIDLLRRRLELSRQQLKDYRQLKESFSQIVPAAVFERDAVFWELTLDAGIKHEAATVEWLEEAIEKAGGVSPEKN